MTNLGHLQGMAPDSLVEVARSFSLKVNLGNYESADFFCSQKAECHVHEAEAVSARVYAFCRAEVMKAVAEFKKERGMR